MDSLPIPFPEVNNDELIALRAIVEGTARHIGDEFFRSLVRNLSMATNVYGAFVAEFAGSNSRVRSLAYWENKQFLSNLEWDLPGTPCEDVANGNFCHHPMNVRTKFPNDPGLSHVESYLGVPLRDTQGMILGHLAIYDVKPMPSEPRLLFTFQIFAARAAAELERLRAEKRIRENEERYRELYEEAPHAYVSINPKGEFLSANRQTVRLLGIEVANLIGKSLVDFATPSSRPKIVKAIETYQQLKEVEGIEVSLQKTDGKTVWIHLGIKPVVGSDERLIGGRSIWVDITARIQTEQEKAKLQQQNLYLQEEIKAGHNFEEIVGHSPSLMAVLEQISRVASTDSTVLIIGETGTGKELIARAVHSASKRRQKPFIKLNCAALPSGLIESELFGHEKGAFTGAVSRRLGRFELADGGTLFLDEVGELPLEAQAKLLRVLQEREFERVGGTQAIQVDVRIIAATNRDLAKMAREKTYREDLFYRLNVFPVRLPPLRERVNDIPLLSYFFLEKFCSRIGKRINGIDPDTLGILKAYPWPGNVRELEHVIERAVILETGSILEIDPEVLAVTTPSNDVPLETGSASNHSLQTVERDHILQILKQTNWVIEGNKGAAKILNLHPNTLRSRMKKLRIARPNCET